ncbi:MAG: hypothetical protein HKN07_06225 [Acidimicrobiia bacterium]|nr:hypothetical protein [Acidimicrobiia bacterium]NNF63837.1 hypothetical protein [Acidimicrobiia bacterium]
MNDEPAIPNELIGRAITDHEFRERFLADPQKTLDDEGYSLKLSSSQLEAVQDLDDGVIDFAIHGISKGRPETMA